MTRTTVAVTAALLIGCAQEPAVPPAPQPWTAAPPPGSPPPRFVDPPERFPDYFTLVLTREYGMWSLEWCRFEVNIHERQANAALSCKETGGRLISAARSVEPDERRRLTALAHASDLFGPGHTGGDLTGTDGVFEALRVLPAGGGPAAVLVTSWNRTFVDEGPRHDLLSLLRQIERGLLEKAAAH